MVDKLPPIYFYLPQADWPGGVLPESIETCPPQNFRLGAFSWTVQTFLRLKADGFPCQLVGTLPSEGIVLAYRCSLSDELRPSAKLLIICIQGDEQRHPYAQIHIVQNPKQVLTQSMLLGDSFLLPGERYHLPHWLQPGLIPRDPARGERFENVAYFGREVNLAPELRDPSWSEQLNELGLRWNVVSNPEHWNNYSEVDVLLAVRSFGRKSDYHWKPATKLYDAWHAGIPAILGYESAFRAERKSELDYIEVISPNEALTALKRLCDDKELRLAMMENSRIRGEETQPENLVKRWHHFLLNVAVPAYERWCNVSPWTQQIFLTRRYLAIHTKDFRKNLQQMRNSLGLRTRLRTLGAQVRGT